MKNNSREILGSDSNERNARTRRNDPADKAERDPLIGRIGHGSLVGAAERGPADRVLQGAVQGGGQVGLALENHRRGHPVAHTQLRGERTEGGTHVPLPHRRRLHEQRQQTRPDFGAVRARERAAQKEARAHPSD